jgi:hypothetical protein
MTKMEKQQAIDFIQRELNNHRGQKEITALLCEQLSAPADVVGKFVSRIASQMPEAAVDQTQAAAAPAAPEQVMPEPVAYAPPEQAEETQSDFEKAPSAPSQPVWEAGALSSAPKIDQAELEAMITKELAKNNRQSDVAVSVCEYTGMNWDDAQRLVARVAMEKRKHLTTRQNFIFIPLAVIAILVGIALVYAGVSESYTTGSALMTGAPLESSSQDVQGIVWAIPTGVGLLLGGGFGLYKALRAQFE